jgi:hypothetical protein
MIMVNYVNLWIVHTQVASQLKGAKLELKELKAHSLLLGACLECPKLKLELDAHSLKVKELETKLLEKPHISVTSPPCEVCSTLKGKLFYATKENSELKQEVAYLSARLERTNVSEKMIEDDFELRRVQLKSHTNWVLVLRDVRIKVKRMLTSLFQAPIITKWKNYSNQPKPTTHPIPSHPSTPREV